MTNDAFDHHGRNSTNGVLHIQTGELWDSAVTKRSSIGNRGPHKTCFTL